MKGYWADAASLRGPTMNERTAKVCGVADRRCACAHLRECSSLENLELQGGLGASELAEQRQCDAAPGVNAGVRATARDPFQCYR